MAKKIEVKIRLKSEIEISDLLAKLSQKDQNFELVKKESQKNNYFVNVDLGALTANLNDFLDLSEQEILKEIMLYAAHVSISTREIDGEIVILRIISSNGSKETVTNDLKNKFEKEITLSLDELDRLIINSKGIFKAKWSRHTAIYKFLDYTVSIDKNAGYGYICEIEKVVELEIDEENVLEEINKLINELSHSPLEKSELDRMFEYYVEHWEEYYETEKTFELE